MTDLCRLIFWTLVDLMRARATLEAEIWVLRQQINVLRRAAPRRQSFGIFDRLIFVGLYRLFPKACDALAIVKPDTIIRWHRAGFRAYWRWKSRRRGGRPTVPPVCVPKTLSELMTRWNRLSWRNDRAALFRSGHPSLAIQVEVAA